MASMVFYQDSRHEQPLLWIRNVLEIGYISRRNDGMTELRINGFKQLHRILEALLPYIRFKQQQATIMLKALGILNQTPIAKLTKSDRAQLMNAILEIQNHNYQSRKKKTKATLVKILDLTP